MSAKVIEKSRRSIELTKQQLRWLKKESDKYNSLTEAGIVLGIGKDVLSRTIAFGSCSEKTYRKLFPSDIEDSSEDFNPKAA